MAAAVTNFNGVPCAAGKTIKGRPFPSFSNEESLEAFMKMEMKDDDIVMLSYPKAGTTWANKMLYLLVRTDEDGAPIAGLPQPDIGEKGQVYPDWVPTGSERGPIGPRGAMGEFCWDDLRNQASPRLYSTHVEAGEKKHPYTPPPLALAAC